MPKARQQVFPIEPASRSHNPTLAEAVAHLRELVVGMDDPDCAPLAKKPLSRASRSARVFPGGKTSTAKLGAPGKNDFVYGLTVSRGDDA